jgi:hypothetical protein
MLRLSAGDDEQRIDPMRGHSFVRGRTWMLLAMAAVLVAGHGVILYYFSSHFALSSAVVAGVIVIAVIKHVGLLGALYGLLRRRSHQ